MDNQKFVATVRRICKAKGLSENDLGWSAGLISRWNKACPSIEKVAELIAYLGVPKNCLVTAKALDSLPLPRWWKNWWNGHKWVLLTGTYARKTPM